MTPEEEKRQAQLKRHRIKSRERYQMIKSGERAVGVPIMQTCKCCGKTFKARSTAKLFCDVNCWARYYRQEAAKERSCEVVCENCGKSFTTTRSNVKYCCDACRYEGHLKGQRVRNAANREKKKEQLALDIPATAESKQPKTA